MTMTLMVDDNDNVSNIQNCYFDLVSIHVHYITINREREIQTGEIITQKI